MSHKIERIGVSVANACLAGVRVSVLIALVASLLGERVLRGARGYARYREGLSAS